jgi:hypothetical protein
MTTPTYDHTRPKNLTDEEREIRKKYLLPAEIDKIPIPYIRNHEDNDIVDWGQVPEGWTVIPATTDPAYWTDFIPFATEWGLIKDNRLTEDVSEESGVSGPAITAVFFDPLIKQEDDWNAYGTVNKQDPPYERLQGYWEKIPTPQQLVKGIKITEGAKFTNPYNQPLRHHNQDIESANRFEVLIEQSRMYFNDPYKFNWRKAIMDTDQEQFVAHEMGLLKKFWDPMVKTMPTKTQELVVREDEAARKTLGKRIEKYRDYISMISTVNISFDVPIPPDPRLGERGFYWPEFVYYGIRTRILTEYTLKKLAKILRHLSITDPDPNNPWTVRMETMGPRRAIAPPPLDDQPDEEDRKKRMRNWKDMKATNRQANEQRQQDWLQRRLAIFAGTRIDNGSESDPLASEDPPSIGKGTSSKAKTPEPKKVTMMTGDPDDSSSDDPIGPGKDSRGFKKHQQRRGSHDPRRPGPRQPGGPRGGSNPNDPVDPRNGFANAFTGRRGTTPLQDNPWLFPPPPNPPNRGPGHERRQPVIENKIKINDLPEFDGSDNRLVDYIFTINDRANLGYDVWEELGRYLPLRFTKKARNWWEGLEPDIQRDIGESWDTLRLAICEHWMTAHWRSQEKIKCNQIVFQANGRESPMGYYYRKLRAIRVSYSGWDEYTIVNQILDDAPEGWQKYFSYQPNTLYDLSDLIQANQHLFKKDADISLHVDQLMEEMKKMKGKSNGNNWSNRAEAGTNRAFVKKTNMTAKANATEPKLIGAHPKFSEFPFPKRDDIVSKGRTPEQLGVRPCKQCGSGKHWDNDCIHKGKKRSAKVNLASANEDLLQALDDYEAAQLASESEPEEVIKTEESSEESGNDSSSD